MIRVVYELPKTTKRIKRPSGCAREAYLDDGEHLGRGTVLQADIGKTRRARLQRICGRRSALNLSISKASFAFRRVIGLVAKFCSPSTRWACGSLRNALSGQQDLLIDPIHIPGGAFPAFGSFGRRRGGGIAGAASPEPHHMIEIADLHGLGVKDRCSPTRSGSGRASIPGRLIEVLLPFVVLRHTHLAKPARLRFSPLLSRA